MRNRVSAYLPALYIETQFNYGAYKWGYTKCLPKCLPRDDTFLLFLDEVLPDHVIARYKVRSLTKCVLHCIINNGCRSFNYQYTLDLSGILGLCEINNATLEYCPRKAVKKVGHGYYRDDTNFSAPTVIHRS